jgi:hypothetical protein
MEKIKCASIYVDAQGESRFGETEVELSPTNYMPPAAPLSVSSAIPASQFVFASAPAQYFGDWHPCPCRQLCVVLSGKIEIQASNGEVRHFAPGDFFMQEDVSGKGHRGRTVHGAWLIYVHLKD